MLRKIFVTATAALILPLSMPHGTAWADDASLTTDELMQQVEWLQVQMTTLLKQIEDLKTETGEATAKTENLEARTVYLEDDVEDLDDRLMKPERHSALDRVLFSGDLRVQAHSISADVADHVNGMGVQADLVNTMFYFGGTGMLPPDFDAVNQFVQDNYSDYQYFTDNLTFAQLKQAVGMLEDMLPPDQLQGFMQALAQNNFVEGYSNDNDLVYTTRMRLRMEAPVAEDVKFSGRLGMYKTWSNSTGTQVFDGQPTSIAWDGTTVGVPNSDVIRVERAYMDWTDIGGLPMYLSVGRRPSTGGVPLNFREDEPRGGTPLGSLINYQFDGITLGYHFNEQSTLRFCYGVGFESEWGNGSVLDRGDSLDDSMFYGLNWDVWNSERMFIQATVARAQDVTDGFSGTVVMPFDPLTGQEAPPAIMRFEPDVTVGDIDLASAIIVRHDGPFDYFLSGNYMESDPTNKTGVFGGLFTDPFDTPEDQDGHMWYAGLRYNLPNEKTKLGVEFNHGSKYWFNFALAEDDFFAPKTSTRGDVWEFYVTHRIRDNFIAKLDYIDYSYDYSGSGWLLGAPKDVDETPVLGFPAYENAKKWMLSLEARF